LFLDELPEFTPQVLDSLRQPLETGECVIARANHRVSYPARIQLVAAMNPCRCGHLADPSLACSRAPNCGLDYQARISGPLIDRLDVQIELPGVTPADLSSAPKGEPSASVASRVARARAAQEARFEEMGAKFRTNADLQGDALEQVAAPDGEGRALLDKAAEALRLTGRGYHRVMRLSRTIADLDGSEGVKKRHVAEAASYRRAPLKR
ncbi:MAG: ATP-binding protein, partial [Pseudomonadota bacterium]